EPNARLALRVGEEAIEDPHTIGVAGDAIVERHHHHPALGRAFLVELVELVLQRLLIGGRVVALDRGELSLMQDQIRAFAIAHEESPGSLSWGTEQASRPRARPAAPRTSGRPRIRPGQASRPVLSGDGLAFWAYAVFPF